MKYRVLFIVFVLLYLLPGAVSGQQYNIVRQGVCWTTPGAVDSSLTRLVYVSVSGAGPVSVKYVNAGGADVDVAGGGTFEMGYCGCCADSTAIDRLYYSFGDPIVNGDTLISPFDSGEIFYISTNGDNATGRKGYMDLPFQPDGPLDSNEVNLTHWYYPGDYSINGALYNTNPIPHFFYAPNSTISISGTGGAFFFRDDATAIQNDARAIEIGRLMLSQSKFIRAEDEDFPGEYVSAKIGYVKHINTVANSPFSANSNSLFEIDSVYTNNIFSFSQPNQNRQGNQFDIKSMTYEDGLWTAFISGGNLSDSCFFSLSIDRLYEYNSPAFYTTRSSRNADFATENINIGQAYVTDTLGITDNTASTYYFTGAGGLGLYTTNGLFFIVFDQDGNSQGGKYSVDIKYGELDKMFDIQEPGLNETYNINLSNCAFRKTKAIQIGSAFTSRNARIYLNFNNVTTETSSVISSFFTDVTSNMYVSGRMQTNAAAMPVIYSAKDFYLENAELINDGVTPAIVAPNPITVYVRGDLYMNSDSIDSNVTFQKIEYGYENCAGKFEDTQSFLSSFCPPAYNGTAFATTDGSGDITVTIGNTMPDATYTALLGAQGSTFQHPQVQSQTATDFVVRFFDAAGSPITSTGVVLDWEVRDR